MHICTSASLSLIYWWSLGLLPYLGYCEYWCNEHRGAYIFFQISVLGFLKYIPRWGITGFIKQFHILIFEDPTYCFLYWLHEWAFPPTVHDGSLLSASSETLAVCWIIDGNLFDRCEVISHCGFNFPFFDDYWCLTSFYMSISLFGEVSIQILCPFFNWTVWFLVWSSMSSL